MSEVNWSQSLRIHDIPAPRLARGIRIFALLCFSLIAFVNVLRDGAHADRLGILLVAIAAVFAIQVMNSAPRARSWPRRQRFAMLALQAVLTYVPAVVFGASWGGMLGCLAGSVLLLVDGPAAWGLYALIAGSSLAQALLLGLPVLNIIYLVQSSVLTGLVIFGLSRLSGLVEEVHASRGELARAAVLQERLRIARDLHDLLGYSLSAITLKAELIHRLVGVRPDRARQEVADVLQVSRQALADVRTVASGYRDMSLSQEAESAASTLKAADIRAEVEVSCGRLHPVVDTALATALREGITNMLRHSTVQHCRITATADTEAGLVRLTLLNDGVAERTGPLNPHGGSGLGNLATRIGDIGGRVEADVQPDGWFALVIEAPLRPATADSPSDPGSCPLVGGRAA